MLDRQRKDYSKLHEWFRLFLRFALGATMITYGSVKAVPVQMPAPSLTRLLEPYGHFSPMGVLWSQVGASRAYEIAVGSAELLGGVLLLLPATALLGALICLVDSTHIFLLNMTYDVPVKLFSFHLVLMSLFLIAPDASRLLNVLLLNRRADPRPTLRPRLPWLAVGALDGTLNDRPMRLELRSVPLDSFLLLSRGVHWIQEYPFNR